jgi:hypothetical protein
VPPIPHPSIPDLRTTRWSKIKWEEGEKSGRGRSEEKEERRSSALLCTNMSRRVRVDIKIGRREREGKGGKTMFDAVIVCA